MSTPRHTGTAGSNLSDTQATPPAHKDTTAWEVSRNTFLPIPIPSHLGFSWLFATYFHVGAHELDGY